MWRKLAPGGTQRLAPSVARFVAGGVIMSGPAWLVATAVPHWLDKSLGPRVGIAAAVLTGAFVFLAIQALWRTPEMGWIGGGLSRWSRRPDRLVPEVGNG